MRSGSGPAVALFVGVCLAAGGLGWLLYTAGGSTPAAVVPPETSTPEPPPLPPPTGEPHLARVEPAARKPRTPRPGSEPRFPVDGHEDVNLRDWKAAAEAYVNYIAMRRDMAIRGRPALTDDKLREEVLKKGLQFNDRVLGPPPGWSGDGVMLKLEHPGVSANLLAATLAQLKLPLTEAQTKRIGDLVRERGAALEQWDADSASIAGTWRVERLSGRAAIVANFWAEVFAVLTPAQTEAVSPAEFRDRLSLDFFSSAVVWFGVVHQLDFVNDKALVESIASSLTIQYSLQEQKDDVQKVVEEWVRDNPVNSPDVLERRGPMKVARVERAAERMLVLLKALVERVKPAPDTLENIRGSGLYVPIRK